jgi:flavin-dependent dehydrogenase
VKDVVVVGGGLSGLISSILLARNGLDVVLIEKNTFPFHRVCGEYISNEVIPFLKKHDLFPETYNPSKISKLSISDFNGNIFTRPLGLGGFGISRYELDLWLLQKAKNAGVEVHEGTKAGNINFQSDAFQITTNKAQTFESKLVISAHGKRSTLDKELERNFLKRRSPFVGVKYHIKTDMPDDLIELHNFEGGYCGVSAIEQGKFNMCYLVHRDQVRNAGSLERLEHDILAKNPALAKHIIESERLFDKPEVINEITFEKKEPVYKHIFMAGDAAGMITPLCGNGMAMAIGGAKLLAETIISQWNDGDFNRAKLEQEYTQLWSSQFSFRLWSGRQIQRVFFGNKLAAKMAIGIGRNLGGITNFLISKTHGKPFE